MHFIARICPFLRLRTCEAALKKRRCANHLFEILHGREGQAVFGCSTDGSTSLRGYSGRRSSNFAAPRSPCAVAPARAAPSGSGLRLRRMSLGDFLLPRCVCMFVDEILSITCLLGNVDFRFCFLKSSTSADYRPYQIVANETQANECSSTRFGPALSSIVLCQNCHVHNG